MHYSDFYFASVLWRHIFHRKSADTITSPIIDDEPVEKRRKGSCAMFVEEEFLASILKRNKYMQKCFENMCLLKLNECTLRTHAQLVSFYSSQKPPDLRKNRVFRTFVMKWYMQQVSEQRNNCKYRLPTIKNKLCLQTMLMLMRASAQFINTSTAALTGNDANKEISESNRCVLFTSNRCVIGRKWEKILIH